MLADLDYRLPAFQQRPKKSVIGVLTTVISSPISSLYAFGHWMMDQLNPLKASPEWLQYWADRLHVPRKQAIAAEGIVQFSNLGSYEGIIPAGTRFHHPALSVSYRTLEDITPGLAVGAIAETLGVISDTALVEGFVLESPIAGLPMDVAVLDVFSGGADEESLTAWAARIDEQLKERQKIGDADDYKRWAKASHPDIEDAVVHENTPHLGFILIRVLGSAEDPVLSDEVIAEATTELNRLRNMAGVVQMFPVQEKTVDIEVADVAEAYRSAIIEAIAELMKTRATFGARLWPAEIERVIAEHTETYTLLYPVTVTAAAEDEILSLGEITWH